MNDFPPHHITATAEDLKGNDGLGRVVLIPGSDGRARRIGDRLEEHRIVESDRRLDLHLGRFRKGEKLVDVAAVSTGMGCPSLDIVVTELIMLGARIFIRVGTAGSMQPGRVEVGDLVIATGAVRDEATSDAYVTRDYPALADRAVTEALIAAAERKGQASHTFAGVIHTKDSLFAREFGQGPREQANREYTRQLAALGALASEMESAHLFVLADVHSSAITTLADHDLSGRVRAGSILAVIGDHKDFADPSRSKATIEAATDVALEAALELASPRVSVR